MQLYTLTSRFFPRDSINEFTSVIWTERYSSAGDVQLVVPATSEMADILAPGTMLGLRGTKEIMMLETQSVENELMTVTGLSMVSFLNERTSLFPDPEYDGTSGSAFGEYTATTTAGQHISNAVYQMLINPTSTLGLDWGRDKIPGLVLGAVDDNGTPKRISFALGPLYDAVQSLASEEGLGFKLYLESAKYSTNTYVLKFATYRGRNRTSEQAVHKIIRLSPQLDSLTDVKELSSISEYKNVIYVSYKNTITTHYIQPDLPIPTGFDRRALFVEGPDIFLTDDHIAEFRAQVARNTLANHIYIQAVDGQVSSKIDYKFGTDYYLGDVVELEGFSGLFSKARITEYIRSQDRFGEQEYPTLAVIDPLQTGYMPDLEPDPDDTNDFDGDPDYDLDLDLDDWDDNYDPEHDPNKRKKQRKKTDPKDPNPDPIPVFDDDPTGGDGDGGGTGAGDRPYILTGYYPDQNNGEALAYIFYGGLEDSQLAEAWIYTSEDPDPDANPTWLEVIPLGWTLDNSKMLVRSEDQKDSTPDFPWFKGYSFWLLDPIDGSTTKLTSTLPSDERVDGLLGTTHGWNAPGHLWCGSDENWHWYLASTMTAFPLGLDSYGQEYFGFEYIYADGTYTTDGAALGHGDLQDSGPGPIELYAAWGGTGEGQATSTEMTRIISKDDLPPHMRWSRFQAIEPSPDGEKLCVSKQQSRPADNWFIQSISGMVGGTFTITVGVFGNLISGYFTTSPIPYNATADYIYGQLALIPYLQDPRGRGYPYTPYYMSSPLQNGGQFRFTFDVVPPQGVYIVTHSENLIPGPLGGAYSITPGSFQEYGDPVWYMADYTGANLTEIDIGELPNYFGGWSPDSTKLHAVVPSSDGDDNLRWMNYDVSTGDISYPLDYSALPPDSYGTKETILGPPKFSPDSQKIAFFMQGDYRSPKKLIVANADGTNALEIYANTADPGQDDLVLGYDMSWSFDSTKLVVVDSRDEAPVWMFNLIPNTMTKIWPGSGWDNSDDQKWIYDPQNFDG